MQIDTQSLQINARNYPPFQPGDSLGIRSGACVHRLLKKDSYRDGPVPCWSCPSSSQEGHLRSSPCWSCPPPSQEGQLRSSSLLVVSTAFSRRTATVMVQFPVGRVHRLLKKDSYRDGPVPCWSCPPSSQEGQLP